MKISIAGKPMFTRAQRVNIISNQAITRQKAAVASQLVAEVKAQLRAEREEKERLARVRAAMISNPKAKIKTNKDGAAYYIPRNEKGHVMGTVIIK